MNDLVNPGTRKRLGQTPNISMEIPPRAGLRPHNMFL